MILLLAHFPTLYKDELLYSGIARYHRNAGNKTQKQTIEDLFGNQLVCASADLPSHLNKLSPKLNEQYHTDQLIGNHTLFPYYTYFMKQEKTDEVKKLMERGSEQGVVHTTLGIPASKIKLPMHLKYCPECYTIDGEMCEPYWHRSHQLPGVYLCPLHKVLLNVSNVEYSTQNHKFSFETLSLQSITQHKDTLIDICWLQHLEFISEQSNLLLKSSNRSDASLSSYKNLLQDKGYMTARGKIRFDRFIRDFQNFYTEELLKYLYCEVNINSYDTWLHKIIRNQAAITHPLRHLLVLRFFGKTLDSHLESIDSEQIRRGPWPCLNKAADHYLQEVIELCITTRCSKTNKPVSTFQCSCGFVFSRRGTGENCEDRYRIGRIKAFGPIWYEKLRCLNATDMSLRQKAGVLGVDPGTIKFQTKYLIEQTLTMVNAYCTSSVKRKSLSIKKRTRSRSLIVRVDWNKRDELLLSVVAKAIGDLKELPMPHRITIASITRFSGAGDLLMKLIKNLNKLPRTKELISNCVDTTESYQIRRLLWAANQLKETEGRVLGWKLLKGAGLNHPLSKGVQNVYSELIS